MNEIQLREYRERQWELYFDDALTAGIETVSEIQADSRAYWYRINQSDSLCVCEEDKIWTETSKLMKQRRLSDQNWRNRMAELNSAQKYEELPHSHSEHAAVWGMCTITGAMIWMFIWYLFRR